MKQQRLILTALLAAPVFFMTPVSTWALAGQSEDPATAATSEAAATVSEIADEAGDAVNAESAGPNGLDIVMDGSSLEAFEQSLEEVRKIGGEQDYLTLKAGFEYLLVFDIGAKNDPEILASRLDGLTGKEILARVRYRRN